MFIDRAKIYVQGGDGGNGVIAFHREKYIPCGGPSGGDGGRGGNVYLVVERNLNTLLKFKGKVHFKAKRGAHGQGSRKAGRKGEDLSVSVPPGTVIKDIDSGEILFDLARSGQRLLVARGGRGGRGNARFHTSIHKAPRRAEKGEPGEKLWLELELKLLADVGITGYPNAGKSTFISRVSAAKPKIADYPFTTLVPNLGVVRLDDFKPLVFADIPGLIEGAHRGVGLGHQFLRHVERCKLLLHIIDLSLIDEKEPLKTYNSINKELQLYSRELGALPQVVAGNKIDLVKESNIVSIISKEFSGMGVPFYPISAVTGEGISILLKHLWNVFSEFSSLTSEKGEEEKIETFALSRKIGKGFMIEKKNNKYIVKGHNIEKKVYMTYLESEECLAHLQKLICRYGIIEALEKEGIQDGDTVVISNFEFFYFKDNYRSL